MQTGPATRTGDMPAPAAGRLQDFPVSTDQKNDGCGHVTAGMAMRAGAWDGGR